MSEWTPKQYSLGCSILLADIIQARTYGRVRRGDKEHWRNYRRAIPGGISLFEMMYGRLPETIPSLFVDQGEGAVGQ